MSAAENSRLEKKSNLGGAREGAGRKPFVPTDDDREKVKLLSGLGIPFEQIAAVIAGGIDAKTLGKYFKDELVVGKTNANIDVAKCLKQKAMNGDTTAAIWWSKTQMRWSEVKKHELTGAEGKPLEFTKVVVSVVDPPDYDGDDD
jgi:hypothetical protein